MTVPDEIHVMLPEDKTQDELVTLIHDILHNRVYVPFVCKNVEEYMKPFRALAYTKFANGLDMSKLLENTGMIYEYYDAMDSSGLFFSAQFLTKKDADYVTDMCVDISNKCYAVQNILVDKLREGQKLDDQINEELANEVSTS